MKLRILYIAVFLTLFTACTSTLEEPTSLLTQVLKFYEDLERGDAVAFGTSANGITNTSYVYFYPVEGATNFQLFETGSLDKVPTNLSNYNLRDLEIEDAFGGRLKRFVRTDRDDVHCIITYQANGVFYQSAPIEIKNRRVGTSYTSILTIDQTQSLMPLFSWTHGGVNMTFHQVVSDVDNNFLSGTFTSERQYRYGDNSNVIKSVDEVMPDLILNDDYNFTLFAIDQDRWVDRVIEKPFTVQ